MNNNFNILMITNKLELLTPKELAVYAQLKTGLLNKEIADKNGVTIDTVKKHCKNIYAKLEVRNRTEAVMLGMNEDREIA
jgi:LuxR family transcriptional regulator, maltose regulon positive regulatory protein